MTFQSSGADNVALVSCQELSSQPASSVQLPNPAGKYAEVHSGIVLESLTLTNGTGPPAGVCQGQGYFLAWANKSESWRCKESHGTAASCFHEHCLCHCLQLYLILTPLLLPAEISFLSPASSPVPAQDQPKASQAQARIKASSPLQHCNGF